MTVTAHYDVFLTFGRCGSKNYSNYYVSFTFCHYLILTVLVYWYRMSTELRGFWLTRIVFLRSLAFIYCELHLFSLKYTSSRMMLISFDQEMK